MKYHILIVMGRTHPYPVVAIDEFAKKAPGGVVVHVQRVGTNVVSVVLAVSKVYEA